MALKLRKKVPPPLGCPMAACMSLLGGVWTSDIIWSLSNGQRQFPELRRAMPVISAKVLSARLKGLEERGVLSRSVLPTTPPTVEYALTELGGELIPAIQAIVAVVPSCTFGQPRRQPAVSSLRRASLQGWAERRPPNWGWASCTVASSPALMSSMAVARPPGQVPMMPIILVMRQDRQAARRTTWTQVICISMWQPHSIGTGVWC